MFRLVTCNRAMQDEDCVEKGSNGATVLVVRMQLMTEGGKKVDHVSLVRLHCSYKAVIATRAFIGGKGTLEWLSRRRMLMWLNAPNSQPFFFFSYVQTHCQRGPAGTMVHTTVDMVLDTRITVWRLADKHGGATHPSMSDMVDGNSLEYCPGAVEDMKIRVFWYEA
ncbi:hypothetical protein P3342_001613 [Pyrenophora teres f. teres]|nr:hypothetical protein P3342_001613 [Pyrenophora teres f. teres]